MRPHKRLIRGQHRRTMCAPTMEKYLMTIQELKPSAQKEGRWLVFLEDATIIRVSEADVADLGLYRGMELDEAQMQKLQDAAALSKLKTRALNIVSVRSVSRRELVKKLTARPRKTDSEEFLPEDAEAAREELAARAETVADWLENLGLLNDEQYARDVVRWCGEKGYGVQRIRDELFRRGVPRQLWDQALEERADSDEAIDRFLRQKLKNWDGDRKELKRVTDALARRGFSWSEISEGLERYEASIDEDEL